MRRNPARPQDEYARGAVRDAITRGEIAVPSACERCGAVNRRCSDGRRYLQAHHPDHRKPLLVEWLCPKCHRQETPLACGERSGNAKLNVVSVAEARRLHSEGATFTALASRFGVDRRTISRAVLEIHWQSARKGGAS